MNQFDREGQASRDTNNRSHEGIILQPAS
jgi:hypothetical protein